MFCIDVTVLQLTCIILTPLLALYTGWGQAQGYGTCLLIVFMQFCRLTVGILHNQCWQWVYIVLTGVTFEVTAL